MTKILQSRSKVLRQAAAPVLFSEIGSMKLNEILKDMKEALRSQDDGVAIAAPQIGKSLRIFVVSGRVFDTGSDNDKKLPGNDFQNDLVFINPKLIKLSKKKCLMEEGCLSVRWLYGEVLRSEKATVE